MSEIFKSKWYLCQIMPDGKRLVRPEFGAFDTESKAFGSMFRLKPKEKQDDSRFIRMERKPEFEGYGTAKGARILKRPNFYYEPACESPCLLSRG